MTNDQIPQIESALLTRDRIPEIFREAAELRLQQGGREYTAQCPFCSKGQRDRKLSISTERPVWHCFRCDEKGNWFSWLYRTRGWEFPEALRFLAELAGVTLEASAQDRTEYNAQQRRADLFEAAQRYFAAELHSLHGRPVLEYLHRRGYTDDEIRGLELGAYVGQDRFIGHMRQLGWSEGELEAAGLIVYRNRSSGARHLGRIYQLSMLWPNSAGRAAGLNVRTVLSDQELLKHGNLPKYWCSAGMEKASGLVGLPRVRNRERIVVVEGGIDALYLNHCRIPAVSLGGKSLNDRQLSHLLTTRVQQLVLCLDMDQRGQEATAAITARLANEARIQPYVASLPAGFKDPDEFVRSEGSEAFLELQKQALSWSCWLGHYRGEEYQKRGALERDVLMRNQARFMRAIVDPQRQREYTAEFALAAGISHAELRAIVDRLCPAAAVPSFAGQAQTGGGVAGEANSEQLTVDSPAGAGENRNWQASAEVVEPSLPPDQGPGTGDQGPAGNGNGGDGGGGKPPPPPDPDEEDNPNKAFRPSHKERLAFGLSDVGIARRIVDAFGDEFVFMSEMVKSGKGLSSGVLVYNGRYWEPDRLRSMQGLMDRVHQLILDEALAWQEGSRPRKGLIGLALDCLSAPKRRNVVDLAVDLSRKISPADLDRHRYKLNCANGTLDLATGELREHERGDFLTMLTPVECVPGATAPRFMAWLRESMGWPREELYDADGEPYAEPLAMRENDDEWQAAVGRASQAVDALQRIVGYILSGDVSLQCWFLMLGPPRTGKSTLLKVLMRLMGSRSRDTDDALGYASTVSADLFQPDRNSKTNPESEIAKLKGVRLAFCDELKKDVRLKDDIIKTITGSVPLQGRFLFGDAFSYMPHFKLVVTSNYEPPGGGSDFGFWRRLRVVPWEVQVSEEQQDSQLDEKLYAELPGILAWAADGYRYLLERRRQGLDPLGQPLHWKQASQEIQESQDLVGAFIRERLEVVPPESRASWAGRPPLESLKETYEAFVKWCKEEQGMDHAWGKHTFNREMRNIGYRDCRSGPRGAAHWEWLRILPYDYTGSLGGSPAPQLLESDPEGWKV